MSANPFSAATPPPLPAQPARPVRPRFITALAWTLIVLSTVLLPISLITVLMVLTGSDGTRHMQWMDFLFVVGRPPATLIAGIGLLCRWRWSHTYCVALLISFGLWHATVMARGPSPERTYTSPAGVPTTVLASSVNYPLHIASLTVTIFALVKLRSRAIRDYFKTAPRPTSRQQPPKSISLTAAASMARTSASRVMLETKAPPHRSGLLTAITIMAAIGIGGGWFVLHGLSAGRTYLPTKRTSSNRHILRAQEPVQYWASIALYSFFSLGSLGLAAFGAREALRIDISGRGTGRFPHA